MPHHVVIDGSNLATEGRAMPSLKQLNEAVAAFVSDNPHSLITIVVDATFGHRIDKKEVAEFDKAVNNNEIVAPPAGAVGRGDAFVLSIANKVKATVLSNDSYQEFHGIYPWLFEEGRLVGGKPVPHIGWVFVPRTPVRGPTSRKAVSEARRKGPKSDDGSVRTGSAEASQPMPVPKAPPPGAKKAAPAKATESAPADAAKTQAVNDLLPFLTFVEHHKPGSSVNAITESYSSHGAYVRIGDVKGYLPLRLMADPAPRSAREFIKLGESITLVVEAFHPARRSIDLAMPTMATAKPVELVAASPPKKRSTKKAAAASEPAAPVEPEKPKKRTAKKAVAAGQAAAPQPTEAAPPKKRVAKKVAGAAKPAKAAAAEPKVAKAAPSPARHVAKKKKAG